MNGRGFRLQLFGKLAPHSATPVAHPASMKFRLVAFRLRDDKRAAAHVLRLVKVFLFLRRCLSFGCQAWFLRDQKSALSIAKRCNLRFLCLAARDPRVTLRALRECVAIRCRNRRSFLSKTIEWAKILAGDTNQDPPIEALTSALLFRQYES